MCEDEPTLSEIEMAGKILNKKEIKKEGRYIWGVVNHEDTSEPEEEPKTARQIIDKYRKDIK